ADIRWQSGEGASRDAIFRKLVVAPEVFQNFEEMGLTAAVEAADPDRWLVSLPEMAEIARQDPFQAALVFPVAYKGTQLGPQHLPLLRCIRVPNLGHSVVGKWRGDGIVG